MLRPVGSLPPRVYWRRRAVVLAVLLAVVLLFALTVHTLGSGNSAQAGPSTSVVSHTTAPPPTTSAVASSQSPLATTSAATSAVASAPSSGAVGPCAITALKIVATTDKPTYTIGDQPVVVMQVTNPGPQPCTQALGDAQIEFRIYNGAARVWGSHDCKIDPTPDVETLPVNATVAKTVTWSGYSSETTCGVRQRVGAGTYTLSAYLSGTLGTTAQFAIAG